MAAAVWLVVVPDSFPLWLVLAGGGLVFIAVAAAILRTTTDAHLGRAACMGLLLGVRACAAEDAVVFHPASGQVGSSVSSLTAIRSWTADSAGIEALCRERRMGRCGCRARARFLVQGVPALFVVEFAWSQRSLLPEILNGTVVGLRAPCASG